MKKIKIAMIGAGHDHAVATFETLRVMKDTFDFVGYAIVPEDEKNFATYSYETIKEKYADIPQLTVEEILDFPGLDAVCIESEDSALTKYAIMAAKKGLHIHMDKPGGVDDAEFDTLIDLVKEKQRVFHLGYMYRYNPAVIKLKEDIAAGKLGEIYSVEAHMSGLHKPEKREWLANYPGGMLYFLGCHLVDLVYSIMGEPEEIIPLNASSGADGIHVYDIGMAAYRYKNGISFVKSTDVEYGGFDRRQLVVCGTKGTVELKPFEHFCEEIPGVICPQNTFVREAFSEEWSGNDNCYATETFSRYEVMWRAFASYINGEKENPFSYEYERGLHKLLLKSCGVKL